MNVDEGTIYVKFVFGRDPLGFILSTCLPAVIANLLGHTTNYFDEDRHFELAIGVNLTIMLVITTM